MDATSSLLSAANNQCSRALAHCDTFDYARTRKYYQRKGPGKGSNINYAMHFWGEGNKDKHYSVFPRGEGGDLGQIYITDG